MKEQTSTVEEGDLKNDFCDINEDVNSAILEMEKIYKRRGQISGLSTGFNGFDELTDGLHPGELMVIAGRYQTGKTSLVMNIVEHMAIEEGRSVGIFSLQMRTLELTQRLLCSLGHVNFQSLRKGLLSKADHKSIYRAAVDYEKSDTHIMDMASLSVHELREKSYRLMELRNLRLIVIDQLELMGSPLERGKKRRVEIAEIASGIKELSKELSIPIIVTAQLKSCTANRADDIPCLSDLGKSAAIGHYADVVALLYRRASSVENLGEGADVVGGGREAELIFAKQPSGIRGRVSLTFLSQFTRFENPPDGHSPKVYLTA